MKQQKWISRITIVMLAVTIGILSSCSGMGRDCHGMKKHKQSNGSFF